MNASQADVKITGVEANPMVKIAYNNLTINSQLIGIYNANNINAAITIGNYFKVSDELIKEAIENYIPENNRSQLILKNGNEIILDAYNANPSSMKSALESFLMMEGAQKVVILGAMKELGTETDKEHAALVQMVTNATELEQIILVRKNISMIIPKAERSVKMMMI